jgi:hypothetical protein
MMQNNPVAAINTNIIKNNPMAAKVFHKDRHDKVDCRFSNICPSALKNISK